MRAAFLYPTTWVEVERCAMSGKVKPAALSAQEKKFQKIGLAAPNKVPSAHPHHL